MNKAELISNLASKTELTRSQATKVVDALFAVEDGIISKALRDGDKVQITGFGSFESKRREARKGRNPRTGEPVDVDAKRVPYFKPGKEMRERLNV